MGWASHIQFRILDMLFFNFHHTYRCIPFFIGYSTWALGAHQRWGYKKSCCILPWGDMASSSNVFCHQSKSLFHFSWLFYQRARIAIDLKINSLIRICKHTFLGIFPKTWNFESIMVLNVWLKGKCSMTNMEELFYKSSSPMDDVHYFVLRDSTISMFSPPPTIPPFYICHLLLTSLFHMCYLSRVYQKHLKINNISMRNL